MRLRAKKYLRDILDAALLVTRFTEGKTLAEFESDVLIRSGVERQLTILCEAMTQLSANDKSLVAQLSDSEAIIGMRVILVHRYADLDSSRVWSTITLSLPVLIEEVGQLLEEA